MGPLLGQNLINRGKREAHEMGINGPLLGMDGHDYLPHGKKHTKKHHKNEKSIKSIKKQHMISGVEFPSLLSDEESKRALKTLQHHKNFKKFVKKFGKTYENRHEYKRRYRVFSREYGKGTIP